MTPAEIQSITAKHLDFWFSAQGDPVAERVELREHVANAITEALERQAKEYEAGAETLRHERDKALVECVRMIAGMQETAKFNHETTAQFNAEEVATGFIHMVLTNSWDKDQMTRILEAWMVKGLAEHPDKKRVDWLNNRNVHVHECMASDTPKLFEHVPAGYGLSETSDLRQAIAAAMQP